MRQYVLQKAGADAVEVHCAHGYLVSSFLSPRTNKRVDEFGGCFENRMRIARLIIENIRKKVGYSIAIICRINSSDEVDGGLDIHDSATIAAYLEDCGVDGLTRFTCCTYQRSIYVGTYSTTRRIQC